MKKSRSAIAGRVGMVAARAGAIGVGDAVPSLEVASTGGPVDRSKMKGKWVVLFFYPKSFTPGCTKESCSLRDAHDKLGALGAVVYGASLDDLDTQRKFKAAHSLPYELIADTDKKLSGAFDVVAPMGLFAARRTFIVAPDGKIAHIFDSVSVGTHGEDVAGVLEKLKASAAAPSK